MYESERIEIEIALRVTVCTANEKTATAHFEISYLETEIENRVKPEFFKMEEESNNRFSAIDSPSKGELTFNV